MSKAIQKQKTDFQKLKAKKKMYKKICFKNHMYELGDTLLFRETENSSIVGKLIEIIPEGGNPAHPKWPMIGVQWYYKKADLDYKKVGVTEADFVEFIGENEVFPSNHYDKVYVDCIEKKCEVHSIAKYDELETIDNVTFFTRANYDPIKRQLEPAFSQWESYCECRKPLNPNLLYIKCDRCAQWFHPRCMGLSDEEAQVLEQFYCSACRPTRGGE